MTIYGYLITYSDETDGKEHKCYGLIAAKSRADAIRDLEDFYDGDYAHIVEISLHSVTDNETPNVMDNYLIHFFVDAAKQNGYEEGEN